MTICQTKNNPYNSEIYTKSYELSLNILNELVKETNAKKERVWERDDLTGINWCKVPSCLVEMGYMTNRDEDEKMSKDEYQEKIAIGIFNGINSCLKAKN